MSLTYLDELNSRGHAVFLYDDSADSMEVAAEYFRGGVELNELCIFVTSACKKDVIREFKQFGFNPTKAINNGQLRLFEMQATCLPDGYFAADYMLHNVSSYTKDAQKLGYSGLRTAGEMSWLPDHIDAFTEAMAYDKNINNLHHDEPDFIGLCLYPVMESSSEIISGVLKTHPSVIYDGEIGASPSFTNNLGWST
jgi:hypothetical protein